MRRLALVILVMLIACKKETPRRELPPALQAAANGFEEIRKLSAEFVLAISADRYDHAYGKLCAGTRAGVSLDAFTSAASANAYLHGATQVDKTPNAKFSIEGKTAMEPITIESTAGIIRGDVYVSNDPPWCITGITLGGNPVLPQPGR